jgi:hypothetical protein
MVLHRSSARKPCACRVPFWRPQSREAEAAGKRMACFLPSYRTVGLGYGGIERPLDACLPLGKEYTVCMIYVASPLSWL